MCACVCVGLGVRVCMRVCVCVCVRQYARVCVRACVSISSSLSRKMLKGRWTGRYGDCAECVCLRFPIKQNTDGRRLEAPPVPLEKKKKSETPQKVPGGPEKNKPKTTGCDIIYKTPRLTPLFDCANPASNARPRDHGEASAQQRRGFEGA